ncbi:MAG: FAD-binding domain-containing protein, partial [bacterium]
GYPVVDAAMRQLNETGWVHNRARMVAASFLVKNLLVDWRWGEAYFMRQLADGDPASNTGNWQWVAGIGADASPYFRVFNPVLQGRRFDPEGRYVCRWVPELSRVPAPYVHAPWTLPRDDQVAYHCRVGRDYPAPVVDLRASRDRAVERYRRARARSR